jgi:hypothetical protein
MGVYTVAPIQYRGVAMRHVGPRDATWVSLSIWTWTVSPRRALVPQTRVPVEIRNDIKRRRDFRLTKIYSRNRKRLAGGAVGGNEHPCSPARC